MMIAAPRIETPSEITSDIVYKVAATRAERAAAYRLIYKSYLRAGLAEPNPHRMRITPYHQLPTTTVFLAEHEGKAISTISLVADGRLGLPMESVYADVVEGRRRLGLRVAEVSCLADRRRSIKRFLPVFCELARLMVQYARYQGVDELLIAVHPRHTPFYRRTMTFETIGNQRDYPIVCGNPAVALCLNFPRIDEHRPRNYDKTYDRFFGTPIPEEHLQSRPLSPEDRSYFEAIVDPTASFTPLGSIGSGRLGQRPIRKIA